jgi:hypothetical protein
MDAAEPLLAPCVSESSQSCKVDAWRLCETVTHTNSVRFRSPSGCFVTTRTQRLAGSYTIRASTITWNALLPVPGQCIPPRSVYQNYGIYRRSEFRNGGQAAVRGEPGAAVAVVIHAICCMSRSPGLGLFRVSFLGPGGG